MTHADNLSSPVNLSLLKRHALTGGAIALAAVLFFVLGNGRPNPAWGQFWMLRPLIITPLAGAAAGAAYYFVHYLFPQRGWIKGLITIITILGYLIGLWLGIVLGFAGTMWN